MSHDPVAIAQADERARTTIRHELSETLFVEAGAGTGKTSALVRRICELVLTDDDSVRTRLSSIAAITFTEAAAAELRERIRDTLEEFARDARRAGDTRRVELCVEALADADLAAISTLHGFAQRLLSEFPVEVGIPPRIEVVDEVQSQLDFDDRWSTFVDDLFDDPDIEEFLIRAAILDVGIGKKSSQLRQVAQIFDDNWDRLVGLDLSTPLAAPIDWIPVLHAIENMREHMSLCSAADDKLLQHMQAVPIDAFASSRSDIDRLRQIMLLRSTKGKHGQRGNWPDVITARESMTAIGEAAGAIVAQLSNQTLTMLSARIAGFTRIAADERRSEGQLEFHDLLVLARQLLRTSPEARAALSDRYRILMLDEFQDTDPIQIELAMLIVSVCEGGFDGTWQDLSPIPGRLFMVGDPKQSIYRFRRADIELFQAAAKEFDSGATTLSKNFRTVAPIIAAVNGLFTELMPEDTAGQAKYSPLLAHREASSHDHRPLVLGGPTTGRAQDVRIAEAAAIAETIAEITANPDAWPVEEPPGHWRPARLADITILVPARTSLPQLTAALDEHDISYRADTGTLVYETQEIRELLTVLTAIDDPTDQLALVGALRSSLYAAGDDDLLHWKQSGGGFELHAYIPDELAGTVISEAITHLRTLAARRWWDEPSTLLLRLIEERDVMAIAALGPRPRDAWRRIRYVVDQARAFSESNGGDLRSYLRWARLQGNDGSKAHEPMLPEPDDASVQIMTIHGSKGLEFPITFVSGLTTASRSGRSGVKVLWPDERVATVAESLGRLPQVSIRRDLQTHHFDIYKEFEGEMDVHEKARLLYVALTRARDHLVVSGFHRVDTSGKPIDSHGCKLWTFAQTDDVERFRMPAPGARVTQESLFGTLFDETASDAIGASEDNEHLISDGANDQSSGWPLVGDWRVERQAALERASWVPVRSATALAQEVTYRRERQRGFVGLDAAWPEEESDAVAGLDEDLEPYNDEPDGPDALPPQTFRRGRAGSAIGSAVHGVLQLLDLAKPVEEEIDRLSIAQAWAESVPENVNDIAAAVRSALRAPTIASCVAQAHWKEVFVAAPVGDITVEGYVDLLVETTEGLVVVDYKTDSVRSQAEVDAKIEHYATQGVAYALALESALDRTVCGVEFVFARPGNPIVRRITDLDERRRQIMSIAGNA